jgi:hypothetical protein
LAREGLEEQGLPVPQSLMPKTSEEPLDNLEMIIWDTFTDLHGTRRHVDGVPEAISFQELWCYLDLTLPHLSLTDHKALVMHFISLDKFFLAGEYAKIAAKRRKEARKGKNK